MFSDEVLFSHLHDTNANIAYSEVVSHQIEPDTISFSELNAKTKAILSVLSSLVDQSRV